MISYTYNIYFRKIVNVKTPVTLTITTKLECRCDFRSLMNRTLMTQFHEHMQTIVNPVLNFMSSVKVEVVILKAEISLQHIVPVKWMSDRLKGCIWVPLKPQDFRSFRDIFTLKKENLIVEYKLPENETLTIASSGKEYPPGMYQILDNVILVCERYNDTSIATSFVPPSKHKVSFYLGFYEIWKPTIPLEDCILDSL